MKNIPNCITVFRIFLVFVFVFFFSSDIESKSLYCVVTYALAGASDVLDGFLARKFKLESDFGKLMDPLADKLMQITVSMCVATIEHSLLWVPIFLILKECAMIFGAAKLLTKDKIVVKANIFGKLASVIYFIVFLVILIFGNINQALKQVLCSSFVVVSVFAFVSYINSYREMQKKQRSIKEAE